jgi:hypothetical protein
LVWSWAAVDALACALVFVDALGGTINMPKTISTLTLILHTIGDWILVVTSGNGWTGTDFTLLSDTLVDVGTGGTILIIVRVAFWANTIESINNVLALSFFITVVIIGDAFINVGA